MSDIGDIHAGIVELARQRDEAQAVLEKVASWLDTFYGPVEDFGDGDRGMTQYDHGHEEYAVRMDVAIAVRAAVKR